MRGDHKTVVPQIQPSIRKDTLCFVERPLFNLQAGASLLLFVVLAALWIESEFASDIWWRADSTSTDYDRIWSR